MRARLLSAPEECRRKVHPAQVNDRRQIFCWPILLADEIGQLYRSFDIRSRKPIGTELSSFLPLRYKIKNK